MSAADWNAVLATFADWPGGRLVREFALAWLIANACHVLGLALLVGAIVPLDLRLMGVARSVPLADLGPFLRRVAACGLGLAAATGVLMLSAKPAEYLANPAFQTKLVLLAAALANVLLLQRSAAFARALGGGEISPGVRLGAAVSAFLWLAVLAAGRTVGFA